MPDSASWLLHQWVVAGIVSSTARFIPIPFVDDIVRDQCRRFVVSRTLSSHQRSDLLGELRPYYANSDGCVAGCLGLLAKAPLKILLFPLRKIVAMVTSIRGVPLEIMRTVLLGRTLDRYLERDEITLNSHNANQMRLAFDETFARMDFRVLRAALTDALSSVSGWKSAAIAVATRVAGQKETAEQDLQSDPKVDSGAKRITEVLDRPDTLELFAEFDRRFDEAIKQMDVR
ncbi:hypothetical protein RMSM_05656 [Rhodopirellula maiorica SM1]|uniref:Uncharacterized protein n=1 Tax=Rhodopirellula maiorica SM1 TaxID=1265738 RepID=M5RPW5_9BACT|nr:hypothetical protein [Rhodopirellula maiorica]EMI17427.1 hypothetical protein RMSM_05656 [Rhodopirellula maiorica SM1]